MRTIKLRLAKDGNNTTAIIPKEILKISGLKGTVNLKVKKGRIIVSHSSHPRNGWDEQIKATQNKIKNSAKIDTELLDWN